MLNTVKKWAIKVISTTGQYLILAPLVPVYVVHLLGEWLLEFAGWCVFAASGDNRKWTSWIFEQEAALESWRKRSIDSLRS